MEEIVKRQDNTPAILDGYVQQGRMFLFNAAQNLIQYGRVLVEAKPLVPHGEFGNWVQTNFGMSERSAQSYMAVWRKFGGKSQFQSIQFSNLQKMLSLPEGTENDFAESHDLENMTAREVEKAVQKVREEERNKRNLAMAEAAEAIQNERSARLAAENMVKELESKDPDRSLIAALAEKDSEIRGLQRQADAANRERNEANYKLQAARDEMREMEEALAENQAEYSRMQNELLNAQSTIAKGDAERSISDQLTCEDFAAAVRGFLGSAAQMPYMAGTFAQITDMSEYRQWDELLTAVEDFTRRARRALETVEGAV